MSFFGKLWNGVKKVGSSILGFGSNHAGDIISGISGLGSAALNYASSSKGIKEQYKYNTLLQKQAQQWSTGMASTAHQLELRDLKKAGLNPILSVTGGSGASAPGATGGSVGMPDYNLGDAITTALAYKESRSVRRQREFQNDLTNAQTGTELERQNTQEEQTDLLEKQQDLVNQQIEDLKNQIKNRDLSTAGMLERYSAMNYKDYIDAGINQIVGSATARYTNERSRGYHYSAPFGISYSGNSLTNTVKNVASGSKPVIKSAVKGVKKINKGVKRTINNIRR